MAHLDRRGRPVMFRWERLKRMDTEELTAREIAEFVKNKGIRPSSQAVYRYLKNNSIPYKASRGVRVNGL